MWVSGEYGSLKTRMLVYFMLHVIIQIVVDNSKSQQLLNYDADDAESLWNVFNVTFPLNIGLQVSFGEIHLWRT